MLALLGTLISSVLSGGATGLLGIFIQRFFDAKSKAQDIQVIKLNHDNALALRRIDIEVSKMEWEGRLQVADREAQAEELRALAEERSRLVEAEERSYAASLDADRATYLTADAQKKNKWAVILMGIVDFSRGMVRPCLTLYLVALAHVMFNWARNIAATKGVELTAVEVKEIIMTIITTLLYLATVAVVWWFGTRPPNRPAAK